MGDPLASKQSENYTLIGGSPLAGPEACPKTLPSLTAAPREPRNLLNAGSTEAASNQGEPWGPMQGTKPGPRTALGCGCGSLPPGVVQGPRVTALT